MAGFEPAAPCSQTEAVSRQVSTDTDFPHDRVDVAQHGPTPIVAGSWHSAEAQSRVRRKRLARVGKSLAVIVDRELLEVLGFDGSTPLELRALDGLLVVGRGTETEPWPNAELLRRGTHDV